MNYEFNIATIFLRHAQREVESALWMEPAVALLGPRQVGKTTLALQIAEGRPSTYLDLERRTDREKLDDAESFLRIHAQAGGRPASLNLRRSS